MEKEMAMEDPESQRRHARKYILFKIPAYDAQTRRFLGLIQDISESGVQLLGAQVAAGTSKNIIVQPSEYVKAPPLHFEAICRWCRKETPDGYHMSGFEITSIDEVNRAQLFKLMELMTLG
jgi:hypothetical protein